MVQVVVAADATEAEEIQTILRTAGIESKLRDETRKILELPELPVSATCVRVPVMIGHAEAVWLETDEPGAAGDLPQKVLVAESSLLEAQEAIEAFTEPDELTGD